MDVKGLLAQLEADLEQARLTALINEQEYNTAIDTYLDRGTITYYYAQLERSFREVDKLQSAINIIKEKLK